MGNPLKAVVDAVGALSSIGAEFAGNCARSNGASEATAKKIEKWTAAGIGVGAVGTGYLLSLTDPTGISTGVYARALRSAHSVDPGHDPLEGGFADFITGLGGG
jgi:hypothetical protein